MKAFIFRGTFGSTASSSTLHKRSAYGGRKGRRAKKRLDERLTWTEVGIRLAQSHGSSTIYVDDRRDVDIPHAISLPAGATVGIVSGSISASTKAEAKTLSSTKE